MPKTHSIAVLVLPEGEVRTTADKRVSVFDAITAATGAKNPRDAWNSLKKQYPEVVGKCDNFKFHGSGQRLTPITDKEGFLYILALLPGDTARAFREASAKLVLRYLEGDPTLAEDIIDQQTDPATLERLATRAKGKVARLQFTETIKLHGGVATGRTNTYAQATGVLNQAVYGCSAKRIQEATGEKNTRDAVPTVHLSLIMAAEQCAVANIQKHNAFGHDPILRATGEVGNDFHTLREKYGIPDIPLPQHP